MKKLIVVLTLTFAVRKHLILELFNSLISKMKKILFIIFFALLTASCRTPRHVTDESVEVHQSDTVYVTRTDTMRIHVQNESGSTEREEIVYRTVTVYDTLGRVRTVVQEDKASRLVANYYRQLYDSLRSELIAMEARHKADSLQRHLQQQSGTAALTPWQLYASRAARCIPLLLLIVVGGAALIHRVRKP